MTRTRPIRRIACNLLWLVPGVVGGSEEYTTDLLRAFAHRRDRYPDLELTLFVNRSFAAAHSDLQTTFPTVVAPVFGVSKALRVVAESTWLAATTRHRGIDVVHHAGGTMPAIRHGEGVVTIHDLQPLVMPEHFGVVKRRYINWVVPPSVRRARVVITLSCWTQREVIGRIGVRPDRMMLVPSGISAPEDAPDEATVDRVLRHHGLAGRDFFLYPAITYPHKNHRVLVAALGRLLRSHPDAVLVLTGGEGPSESELGSEVEKLGVGEQVRRTGRVRAEELEVLYRRASALTFPSCHEGFGIPVLEAMVRGCPVLAAEAAALPEIVGAGGVLVPADDPEAWAENMASVLDDPGWRRELVDRGARRAEAFSWAHAADALAEAYRVAAS